VLYPLALRAAQSWEHLVEPDERDFGWFAARAFFVIDWVPQRVSAFAFAAMGNFEDALYCWRSQAAAWLRPEEGIVLASGAGALGVRLGEPIPVASSFVERPPLGSGELAREDALASLGGPVVAHVDPLAHRVRARRRRFNSPDFPFRYTRPKKPAVRQEVSKTLSREFSCPPFPHRLGLAAAALACTLPALAVDSVKIADPRQSGRRLGHHRARARQGDDRLGCREEHPIRQQGAAPRAPSASRSSELREGAIPTR
jgi:hypothetical protein